ncbi:MAG: protein-L-isoaspartate(D-aspartate) O-methyltransferase [Streptosporangiales bacterium]|nr:protein-L-isoaspartate(D-aspartate) O-methyltransferase [Streptosporangiales bacterium]
MDDLMARGVLTAEPWRQALYEVPRHLFVPSTGWACPDIEGGTSRTIDRNADPNGWWDAVYSDASIVLQADDGATDPATGKGMISSSISAPGVVVAFLELLNVGDHDRVLEIGTGSGWTAALLSWRVGEGNVTSIEVDEEVAAGAARNLKVAGYTPELIIGDGGEGWADGAPYDRVHVTCAVNRVPYAWVEQTRPGGVIVLPWSPGSPRGYRVRFEVLADGTAVGRVGGPALYMMLRSQRQEARWNPHHADAAERTTTQLDPRTIADAGPGADLAVIAQVPRLGSYAMPDDDGGLSLLLFEVDEADGSWAACDYTPGADEFEVSQYGDRRLWNEVEQAFLRWISWGRPGRERFGITLTRESQGIWLDSPDSGNTWT